jgi:pimeloyl-ACP methyl ester carboxylesterase
MATVTWSETQHTTAGIKVHVSRAGKGKPVLVLHHDIGTLERLPFYEALAATHEVLVPHHPGYGKSERPAWMRNVRDIAVMYRWLLKELSIENAALVGLGFGGWIAAEMATMAPSDPDALMLVGPMGIKPTDEDILDQAIVGYIDYARAFFHDPARFAAVYGTENGEPSTDQLEQWDICREMNFRIAWKPYMYSQTLPHLIGAISVPTLIAWGEDDKVVPISAAARWTAGLPSARLERIPDCGHAVDMEKPDVLAKLFASLANS